MQVRVHDPDNLFRKPFYTEFVKLPQNTAAFIVRKAKTVLVVHKASNLFCKAAFQGCFIITEPPARRELQKYFLHTLLIFLEMTRYIGAKTWTMYAPEYRRLGVREYLLPVAVSPFLVGKHEGHSSFYSSPVRYEHILQSQSTYF